MADTFPLAVDTISILKGLPVPPPPLPPDWKPNWTAAIVRWLAESGDGGGGTFIWNPTGTRPPKDDVVVVYSDNYATGWWERVVEGGIDPIWFGAKADGTGNDATPINKAILAAAVLGQPVRLVGKFRITGSIRWDRPVSIEADCDIICGADLVDPADPEEGYNVEGYNKVRYHTGQPTDIRVAFDLRGAKGAVVTGSVRFEQQKIEKLNPDGTPVLVNGEPVMISIPDLAAVGAVGASEGLYSLQEYGGLGLPNLGGSGTTWQAIEIKDFDWGVYAPEIQGKPAPSGLPAGDSALFGKAELQAGPLLRPDKTWAPIEYKSDDIVVRGGQGLSMHVAGNEPGKLELSVLPGAGQQQRQGRIR